MANADGLRAGDRAPTFTLPADDGSTFDLAKQSGKTVVYFYPRDDTPGCTVEAIDFSKAAKDFERSGAKVVGISKDSIAAHCRFRDKHKLAVRLLSDPDLSVHRAYGAFGEKTMYGKKVEGVIRSTFLVGTDGRIERVWPTVKVAGHVEQVLSAVRGEAAAAPAKKPAAKRPVTKAPIPEKATAKKPVAKKPAAKVTKRK